MRHAARSCTINVIEKNPIFRVIDANFNRAREALRVMEEFGRFVLDDALLTESCKVLRHDLLDGVGALEVACQSQDHQIAKSPNTKLQSAGSPRSCDPPESPLGKGGSEAVPPLGNRGGTSARAEARGSLIEHRNIVGDVGREVTAGAEYVRSGAADVAMAAAARLGEALRCIEEYGKTRAPDVAARIEQLRYRGYELERRLARIILARERWAGVRLYVILTESLCSRDWFETAKAALDGGADALQIREKRIHDAELFARVKRLAELCRTRDKFLIVNDRPDIAAAAGAHGVHLGQDDMPVAGARRILPAWAIVGKSTHTVEQFRQAASEAPDYLAVGPMFPSETKLQDLIAGPGTLTEIAALTSLPIVAIGGINQYNAADLLKIAPICLCVCSAIISQPDPAKATRQIRELIGESETNANQGDSGQDRPAGATAR